MKNCFVGNGTEVGYDHNDRLSTMITKKELSVVVHIYFSMKMPYK